MKDNIERERCHRAPVHISKISRSLASDRLRHENNRNEQGNITFGGDTLMQRKKREEAGEEKQLIRVRNDTDVCIGLPRCGHKRGTKPTNVTICGGSLRLSASRVYFTQA